MTNKENIISIVGARRIFRTPEGDQINALDGVSLDIRSNEFLTLLGPSGCGKTTLLKVLAGFEDLDGGDLLFEGRPLVGIPPYKRPFNTVFQHYALFPHLSVADNVGYGLDVAGVARNERDRRVGEALEMVSLSGFGGRKPRQLSGGQQQRVALARAIVTRPKLLLLDEPLSALDRKLRQSMQIELKNLQHTLGITFVFVTHDQEEALAMSDRIAVMRHGSILQLGSPTAIYHRPENRFVASFVGHSNLFAGRVVQQNSKGSTIETPAGLQLHTTSAGFATGSAVEGVLRPEHVQLCQSEAATLPTFEGTIEQLVFTGSEQQVHARLSDNTLVTALYRGAERLALGDDAIGTKIRLKYAPEHVHVMLSAA